jgi:poly-gamma-glutamate synthesis protein (capsule biosynthesis protein)
MYFATVEVGTGELIGLEMTPLRIRRFRLHRATRDDAEWLQRRLDLASAPFGARMTLGAEDRLTLS